MTIEIKGIHLEVTERIRQYIDLKLPRLDFAKDLIVDCLLNLTREKNLFKVDATINFRWGSTIHMGVENFNLNTGIDDLFDRLEAKVEKEKSKIQEHHKKKEPAPEQS
ncbi:MAG: ribosome-associated translation inhibitor RaiA [Spirochaetia bacterium]|jgi:putative sigma-54 modulation protein